MFHRRAGGLPDDGDPQTEHRPRRGHSTLSGRCWSRLMFTPSARHLAASAGLLCLIAAPAFAEGYSFTYSKQQVRLDLDPTRVAVFSAQAPRAEAERAASTAQALAPFGIDERSVKAHVVSGWSVAELSGAERSQAGVEALVPTLAQAQAADFISPVFLDDHAQPYIVTPHLLVHVKPGTDAKRLFEDVGATIVTENFGGLPGFYRVRVSERDGFKTLELANNLASLPEVESAEPDAIATFRKHFIPNDSNFSVLWGLHNTGQSGGVSDMDIDAPEAWDIVTGSPNIKVAVLDDGVQSNHPDINQVTGADLTGEGSGGPVNNCDAHGTAVAGCISAIINNAQGVVGVSPASPVMSLRISISNIPCDGMGSFQISWYVDALAMALQQGVRVTNTSAGFVQSDAISNAFASTQIAGMVHFVSSGNSGNQDIGYPANLASVNAVGACNRQGNRASFSSWGSTLDFVAPGQSILTTDRTGTLGYSTSSYATVDGTSFASPYAAGVAALILSLRPDLNGFSVAQIMRDTAVDRGTAGFDTQFGWGIVNARNALVEAQDFVPPVPGAFNLVAPADGASGVSLGPLLDWSPSSGVSYYVVTLDDDSDFSSPQFSFNANISQLQLSNNTLTLNKTYYWKVVAINNYGPTSMSPVVASFNTGTPPPACPGDTNGDNVTNGADLSVLLSQFGQSVSPGTGADFNNDGVVNGSDLSVLLSNFGCAP